MAQLPIDDNRYPIQALAPTAPQAVAYTAVSAQSAALSAGAKVVRLVSTTDCFVLFGANPTATTSSHFLRQGVPELFAATGGDKIAAVQSTAGGTLYISEMV